MEDTGNKGPYLIGEVARITGFPAKTLRYYEELGLVEPGRSESGYRLYDREDVARLGFVGQAKQIGLTLGEIKELVELAAGGGRGEVIPRLEEILRAKMEETERRMAELAEFREHVAHYQNRLAGTDPAEGCGCGDGLSFCGCLGVLTGEGERLISPESIRRKR
jgi:MerR family transcriptional regulator, copper efflux regulator